MPEPQMKVSLVNGFIVVAAVYSKKKKKKEDNFDKDYSLTPNSTLQKSVSFVVFVFGTFATSCFIHTTTNFP